MTTLAATLLASAAGVMLIDARTARGASSEMIRLAQADFAVEELISQVVVRLDAGEPLQAGGLVFEDARGGRVFRQDAAGLVDVNRAPPETLARLFLAIGVESAEAVALADRVADWRDEDTLARINGAEAEEYAEAGVLLPANRAFSTEGELALVLGMGAETLHCVLPYLTIYSGQADIDVAAAPPALAQLLSIETTTRTDATAPIGRVIRLTAEAPLSGEAVMRRTIWLRLTGDAGAPVLVHRGEQSIGARNAAPLEQCVAAPS
ncbi:general secretion pathway protein K [alpha proteobacterium U9-1i]|nr:general secretion pathway protein K [alpha proteobacterium U9-1i]